jgi:3-oxoacyl-[acyl-carrier protein] reductase
VLPNASVGNENLAMDLGLAGKVALVGGSSQGLGFAIAESLMEEGAAVVICGRNQENLTKAEQRLSPLGKSLLSVKCDLGSPEGIAAVVSAAETKFGRIDILVANTGGPPPGTSESLSWKDWQSAVDLLLRSSVELTRLVLPGMKSRRWGRVIGITSTAAKQPVDNLILSNSIRPAVTGFFRTLADEVAASGITVNTALPGYTNTERLKALGAADPDQGALIQKQEEWRKSIPLGRFGEPKEFAALVTFLASEKASYITGQAIAVDGGRIRSLF